MAKDISVKSDLIRDSGLEAQPGLTRIKRSYVVENISGTASVLEAALVAPGVPRYGESHPDNKLAIARSFEVKPIRSDSGNGLYFNQSAQVIVTYENLQPDGTSIFPNVRFGSTLQQVTTDTVIDPTSGKEKPVWVYWSGGPKQRAEVPKFVRMPFIELTKYVIVKGDKTLLEMNYPTPIEELQERYHGKVNSSTFRGGKAHEWCCTQFDADTQDWGKSYMITVRVERKPAPDTWDAWAWYKLPNGDVPANANKSKEDGVRRITGLHGEADFNNLGTDLSKLSTIGG